MKNKELKDLNQKAKERKHKTHYETSEFFYFAHNYEKFCAS